jgi:CDP-glucose 4,6-dehydratase
MEKMVIDPSFWKNKKVFVTGHTGFKGGWLSSWLNLLGADITGYALPPDTNPNFFELTQLSNKVTNIYGDIRDFNNFKNAVENAKPEVVFHLAAQPLVIRSYENPIETYSTNLMGTVNLLEILRSIKSVKSVVVITTDKVYENDNQIIKFMENDHLGGHDPYSASKACCEVAVSSFRRSFFVNDTSPVGIATLRAGNVIGGGDWSGNRLIPDLLRASQTKKEIVIRNPSAIRPWQHVLEPISAYLLVAQLLEQDPATYSQAFNVGPNTTDSVKVSELCTLFQKHWHSQIPINMISQNKFHEMQNLMLDHTKISQLTGWKPKLNLESSLKMTAEWYQEVIKKTSNATELTETQIQQYSELPVL